ncbi:hypothetical protein AKJ09_00529 [Labilithrix luteola]|uniref:Outer membrane lipoprotein BamD-like domain-containing protein n=1 Tax=Labilithrix luteola TaxID=1391654 RepID=A0A0K1PK11_9BACT|nr:outer membrane protein assembly factor BamD [Labilithrix luteola]AKU93865.1 hypothetical protein AKJ09_00529 [Labilithrix luteola]
MNDADTNPGPLDPELSALFDDLRVRDAEDPAYGEDASARVLARVEDVVRSGGEASPGLAKRFLGRGPLLGIVSLCLVAGVVTLQRSNDVKTPQAPLAPVASFDSSTPSISTPPSESAPAEESAVPTFGVHDLPTSMPRSKPAPSAGGLSEEYALVESARAKLAAKDYAGAGKALREHAARFPTGQLVQESESLRIQALVETGRIDEAREHAHRFRARFPSGLLLPSVARAVADDAPAASTSH